MNIGALTTTLGASRTLADYERERQERDEAEIIRELLKETEEEKKDE